MYVFKNKNNLPTLSRQNVVHFTSNKQLEGLILAYNLKGDIDTVNEGYFWENFFNDDAVVAYSKPDGADVIPFNDLLLATPEPERFVWVSKAQDEELNRSTLRMASHGGMIHTVKCTDEIHALAMKYDTYHLSEEQIIKWGFNPESFTKHPVEQTYLWTTRAHDKEGKERVLQLVDHLAITSVPLDPQWQLSDFYPKDKYSTYWLTESEIRLWGFDPTNLNKSAYEGETT